jgi:glyoxylase-like metal-dependent hydrolase (beta-lactamase superfamily II)
MPSEITTINMSGVNCYLLRSAKGFVLIDAGFQSQRRRLDGQLERAGCKPGNLKLVLLTHGDIDHTGNCAYLRKMYGAAIAIHGLDAPMVEQGDMGVNRKAKPDKVSFVFRVLMLFTKRLAEKHPFEKFKPDFEVEENFNLAEYGLDAKVVHIPGHSKGSIGILTAAGELFCGDMFYNMPGFRLIDDLADHESSRKKLDGLKIERVYPGHGKPFSGAVIKRK